MIRNRLQHVDQLPVPMTRLGPQHRELVGRVVGHESRCVSPELVTCQGLTLNTQWSCSG